VSAIGGRPAAATAGAPPAVPPRATPRPAVGSAATTAFVRLATFAALALFAGTHWAALVESPLLGRTVLVVLVATGTGAVLALLGAPGVRPRLTAALGGRGRLAGGLIAAVALLVGLAGLALALGAAGLPLRLLGPNNWDELFDGLDRGLAGAQTAEWPYDGADSWVRLTTLLGAPCLIGLAALAAFFPARRFAGALSWVGLVSLLVLYGSAVTEKDPRAPLLQGLMLLVLIAAWLWLPRLSPPEALAGAGLVLSLGALSLPVAAALDTDRPWWNYGAWTWLENDSAITFDWTHRYGPLDWPREGTTLLNVKSNRAHYWKAETLDTFDGLRWIRGTSSDATQALQDLPSPASADGHWNYFEWNRKWDEEIRFTVRSLSTDLLVSAGIPYRISGAGLTSTAGDGTTRVAEGRLNEGDSYTVETYAPNPTPEQMRNAPGDLSTALIAYTAVALPGRGASGLDPDDATNPPREEIYVPLWGNTPFGDPEAPRRKLESSVYGEMFAIASRVTAGAPSMYDAVRRVERYLDRNLTYSEKPRPARYPLNAFLFRDKFGYCQQFSGAMALMLRMAGIPARVAAGFAPGSFNRDSGEYRVRDLDAHSWVEVYFNGIGWVTFDPTPAAAPAERPRDLKSSAATAGAVNGSRAGLAADRGKGAGGAGPGEDSGGGLSVWLLLPLLLLVGAGVAAWRIVITARRLGPEELAEAQLAELRRALARLHWDVPAGTTLLGLERRLGRAAGPAAARYAAALRAHRYDPRAPGAPSLRQRRELRRDLTARSGLRGRVIGLIVIPPGGPRPA
jgi:protein-glutamine gamma-glutamyltransferase